MNPLQEEYTCPSHPIVPTHTYTSVDTSPRVTLSALTIVSSTVPFEQTTLLRLLLHRADRWKGMVEMTLGMGCNLATQ